jgi:Flp pilus assembly protein TadD
MSKLIPAAERIVRARALIQQARDLPVPTENGRNNFSYIAQVKSLLQQARDLIKFIRMTPSATPEIKEEVNKIYQEADQADREILHG